MVDKGSKSDQSPRKVVRVIFKLSDDVQVRYIWTKILWVYYGKTVLPSLWMYELQSINALLTRRIWGKGLEFLILPRKETLNFVNLVGMERWICFAGNEVHANVDPFKKAQMFIELVPGNQRSYQLFQPRNCVAVDKLWKTYSLFHSAFFLNKVFPFQVRYKGFKSYDVGFIDEGMRETNSRLPTVLVTNLVPGTRYQFQVATKAGCNDSEYSNMEEAVTRFDGKILFLCWKLTPAI